MDKGTKMIVLAGVLVAGYMYYKKSIEEEVDEFLKMKMDQDDVDDVINEDPG